MKIERNSLCTCGSGKKYKKCCLTSERKPIQVFSEPSDLHEVCDNALAMIEAGDLLSAEAEAEHLYNLYPDDPMVNFLQGVCELEREQHQKAISFFEKAVQINPWYCEAYFNLAGLYLQEKKIPQSIACLKKIIEIEGIHGDLGKLAKKKIDSFEERIQKSSGKNLEDYLISHALFEQAYKCLIREEYRDAISLFEQVLTLDPNHVQSYGNMALAYSALGAQQIAIHLLDKALLLDPTYEPAQQNREHIRLLKEGEKPPFIVREVSYYKERFEAEGKNAQTSTKLTWSPSTMDYVPLR